MASSKIYIFKLSDDERATLQKNISQQKKLQNRFKAVPDTA